MDQATRERKQQYLREKILDQNYDAEEFMDFCESNLGSVDIDSWQFQQLVDIVEKFIDSQNQFGDFESGNAKSFGQVDNQFGQQFGFSHSFSPQKKQVSSDIQDQFSSWGNFINTEPPKKQQPKFQLNLLDLDFLSSMGGQGSSTQPLPQNKIEQQQKRQSMPVPHDVVKKLQEGNQGFIVGYNSAHFQPQKSQKDVKQSHPVPVSNMQPPSQKNPRNKSLQEKVKNDQFSKQLQCKKVVNKSRLTGNESIFVTGHQIINPNIFVPKFVMYSITTHPHNIQVKRRLKDFQNLRVLLKKFFPLTHVPHLQRCSRLSETEPDIIKKQILFLESFLNTLIMKKQLKCRLVEEFLLCKDLDLLKKIFKEYEKLSKPRSVEGLFTPSGNVDIKINSENRKFVENQTALNEFLGDYFTKMKCFYDDLVQNFEKGMKIISDIEGLHNTLNNKIKVVNSAFTPEYQCPSLQKSLERIQYMHKQWSHSFKTQARIISSQIRHLYRYERDNAQSLKQLLKIQQDFSDTFWKRPDREQAGQDYNSKRLQQFKVSLQNPSKNITVMRYQYGYILQKSCQECLRYLQSLSQKLDAKYKLFCTLQLNIGHEMEGIWKNFETFYK